MTNVHELNYLKEKIQQLKEDGVYRKLPVLNGANEAECMMNGKKIINLSSNNYLGFANHPRIKKDKSFGLILSANGFDNLENKL